MSKRNKRLLSAFLALAAALSLALAEEAAPAPEITAEPTAEATAVPTAEPTAEPTIEATAEPTIEPSVEPTIEPSAEPSIEPTSEPTSEPAPEATPAPSPEASAEPDLSPSPEPTPETTAEPSVSPEITPEPSLPPQAEFAVTPESMGAQQMEGIWQIPVTGMEAEIAFVWPAVEGADGYIVELIQRTEEAETILSTSAQAECRLALPLSGLPQGRTFLRVTAMQGESMLAQAEIQFEITQSGLPGGFPGGMGGRPSGMVGMEGMLPEAEQGFRVTPGEALIDSHKSGTGDMRIYNSLEIDPSSEETTAYLGISRSDGAPFHVQQDGDALIFSGDEPGGWVLRLRDAELLAASGVRRIVLGDTEIDTSISLQGRAYGLLRSRGLVSKDFLLTVDAGCITVSVDGESYILNENGELRG